MSQSEPALLVWLRDHRTAHDLTQARLADLSGLSRKTINTIENGVFTPSVRTALILARVLNVTVEELFSLAPDPSA